MTPFILSAAEIRSISHPCIASKSLAMSSCQFSLSQLTIIAANDGRRYGNMLIASEPRHVSACRAEWRSSWLANAMPSP
jgi:hypothetical protein